MEKMQMGRTKLTNILKNVIGEDLKKQLKEDIGDTKFSILADESTDICVNKTLVLTVKYFNSRVGKIVDDFLGTF